MKDLFLKDILNLNDEEISGSKIALNMSWGGKSHFDRWNESPEDNRDVSYSYASHYGKYRNFTHEGQLVFGFVQLPGGNSRWLLVTAGRVTKLVDSGPVEHEEIAKYQGYLGRLVIELAKGNTYQRYVFNLSKYINDIKVVEVLPNDYQPISFRGLDNVHLSFHDLKLIISGERYDDYKNALMSVKGVYCLTDTSNGKLYIGSAYGDRGIAQRWSDYINTKTGGNDGLIELYNQKGEDYFEQNFEFTLIEYFGMNADADRIIGRETYWKNAFSSKKNGYNKN
jgi:hypothetical protein